MKINGGKSVIGNKFSRNLTLRNGAGAGFHDDKNKGIRGNPRSVGKQFDDSMDDDPSNDEFSFWGERLKDAPYNPEEDDIVMEEDYAREQELLAQSDPALYCRDFDDDDSDASGWEDDLDDVDYPENDVWDELEDIRHFREEYE
jgi:hypothetical protein